ncbi:MAG TPA: M20/M25/M40 family metallo-hydrolase [Longimicrobiaceae bacterium]|nr:M20/M25/M40 family metallo-hydrolase [Longimicrobiaceae bacterium]
MMGSRLFALAAGAALTLGGCAAPASTPPAGQTAPAARAAATITEADVAGRIEYLASDALRGRDTPSAGLDSAAAYLIREVRAMGLEPAGENGTFYQRYPFPLRRLSVDGTRLTIVGAGGEQALQYGRDFFVSGGTRADLDAALVFAGREIEPVADEAGLFRDKIAIFATPGGSTRDWRMLRTRQASQAQREGARAAIHILDSSWTAEQIAQFAAQAAQPARTLGADVAFPQFMISHTAGQRLFTAAGIAFEETWRRAETGEMRPMTLPGLAARGGARIEDLEQTMAPNVVAILPGRDPALRDEYVLLSAHMDHVGVGRPVDGDSVYNGADDNASGTSGLLEVARVLSSLPERPRRSVVFLWVSGEEKGLLGSRWFADNPTFPIERVVANINADMIGSDRHRDSVVVIGKDYSTLGEVVNRVNAQLPELRLVASDDIWPEQQFFYRSDHVNFLRKEIPALFFFTGVHECYHQPCDTLDFVDTGKAARVATLILHTVREIADADRRPEWDPAGLAEVRSLTR